MKIFISVKQAGKRKNYLTQKELFLKRVPTSLKELITEIVSQNVSEYNQKLLEPPLIKYLTSAEIDLQAQTGKVGFGERLNPQEADLEKAIETALVAFTDGIYRVFIGEQEVETLDEPLVINEGDVLTFIRFTMLAGRMW